MGTDIVGFQQIRRPNFDRHGAWLTMGNVELHLIKGKPDVRRGSHPADLIVSHLAIEISDADAVLKRLHELQKQDTFSNLHWRQNISVPTPETSFAARFEADHTNSKGKVTQFFLEDPDGYWIELCNCQQLTAFCFGKDDAANHALRYEDGCVSDCIKHVANLQIKTRRGISKAQTNLAQREIRSIILDLSGTAGVSLDDVNEEYLENLKKRRNTYGDICQGFSDDELQSALAKAGNVVPTAILVLTYWREKCGQVYNPPNFLIDSEKLSSNEPFTMPVRAAKVCWSQGGC